MNKQEIQLRRMTSWQNSQWLRSGDSKHRLKPEVIAHFSTLRKGMGAPPCPKWTDVPLVEED